MSDYQPRRAVPPRQQQYRVEPDPRQQQGYGQQYPQGYGQQQPMGYYDDDPLGHRQPPARKKRRVFLWVFLTIQALFLVWLIAGIAGAAHGIPAYCHQGTHSQFIGVKGCTEASQTGAALGAAAIIVFWVILDIILGISYGIYRLATRDR